MRESAIEQSLVRATRKAGGIAYKFTSPSRRGVPDRLLVLPGGRIIFVEVKTNDGHLSPLQEIEIARLRDLGARVEVVWSVDQIDEVLV